MEIKIHLPPWPRLRLWLFFGVPIGALLVFWLYLIVSASIYSLIYPKEQPSATLPSEQPTAAATTPLTATPPPATPIAATSPVPTPTPTTPVDNLALARQYLTANQWPEAYAAFKLVVTGDAKNLSARSQLRTIALKLNQVPDLKKFYEELMVAHPQEAAYPLSLGTIYMTVDRNTSKARSLFEQSLKLDPNNTAARYNLSVLSNY